MNVANFIFFIGTILLWASSGIGIVYGLYQWGPGTQRFSMAVWRGFVVWVGLMVLGGVLFLIGMIGS